MKTYFHRNGNILAVAEKNNKWEGNALIETTLIGCIVLKFIQYLYMILPGKAGNHLVKKVERHFQVTGVEFIKNGRKATEALKNKATEHIYIKNHELCKVVATCGEHCGFVAYSRNGAYCIAGKKPRLLKSKVDRNNSDAGKTLYLCHADCPGINLDDDLYRICQVDRLTKNTPSLLNPFARIIGLAGHLVELYGVTERAVTRLDQILIDAGIDQAHAVAVTDAMFSRHAIITRDAHGAVKSITALPGVYHQEFSKRVTNDK